MIAYIITGFTVAVGAVFTTARLQSATTAIGTNFEFNPIAAAVVGGASLAGGRGSVIGCIAAAGILGIISNILNLTGASSYYQYVLQGVLLIAALTISALRANK